MSIDRERESFEALLDATRRAVDAELEARFDVLCERAARYGPATFATARSLRAITLRGGKRFRPAMLAAAYVAAGDDDDVRAVTKAGVALELLQSYFLIHDDWMDQDETRRGGPSVHAELGRTFESEHAGAVSAILAGDLAIALAQSELLSQQGPSDRIAECARIFASTQSDVVFGQILDVHAAALGREDVELVHSLKTASYTALGPVRMGAALASATSSVRVALDRYAGPLGIAFQLRDDLLGVFGDPRVTGKPVGADIRRGKRTALVLDLFEDDVSRPLLSRVFGRVDASDGEIEQVVSQMIERGARARLQSRLEELLTQSRDALRDAPLRERGRSALLGALTALGQRSR
ncbi:Hypothetical protein I5071_62340 [Sandaracinus amylolyticus]|nr:Hypothetical protein I5071_62340 [Sandaracinus amylolyticus]